MFLKDMQVVLKGKKVNVFKNILKKDFTACWANSRVALWCGFAASKGDASVLWFLTWLRLFSLAELAELLLRI